MLIRLQKYLADAGIASRRKSEEYIERGMVKVNGEITKELGVKVDPEKDAIFFDNKKVVPAARPIYILLNKPKGYVATCLAHKGERSVLELVEIKERLWPVGRLDKDSEGLMILTNDGELTDKFTHPRYEKEKEYEVWVDQHITREFLNGMKRGVDIGGYKTMPAKVKELNNKRFGIILKEGKKRQIREMCGKFGYSVERLVRIRIGNLKLGNMKAGEWKELSSRP